MFELTSEEYDGLRRQIGTLKRGWLSKYLITICDFESGNGGYG
jgi:hypothetical protein